MSTQEPTPVSRQSRDDSPMLTAAAIEACKAFEPDEIDGVRIMAQRDRKDVARSFLAAQDREELLQTAANAAWPVARRLCQDPLTDMSFGDVVQLTRAVIAHLLGDEVSGV